jgi:hypothetical protein
VCHWEREHHAGRAALALERRANMVTLMGIVKASVEMCGGAKLEYRRIGIYSVVSSLKVV